MFRLREYVPLCAFCRFDEKYDTENTVRIIKHFFVTFLDYVYRKKIDAYSSSPSRLFMEVVLNVDAFIHCIENKFGDDVQEVIQDMVQWLDVQLPLTFMENETQSVGEVEVVI